MKRIICISIIIFGIINSCKKEKNEEIPISDKKVILENIIFNYAMESYNNAQKTKSTKNYPINPVNIDYTINSNIKGSIRVTGLLTGNINIDNNYNFLGSDMSLLLWENFYDYTVQLNDKQYSLTTPFSGVLVNGEFHIDNNYYFVNNSNLEIDGIIDISGNFGSERVFYDVKIIINRDGNGGRIIGTINDIEVDYTF